MSATYVEIMVIVLVMMTVYLAVSAVSLRHS